MSVAVMEPLRLTLGMGVSVTLAHPMLKTSLMTGCSPVNEAQPCYYILSYKIDT